MKILFDRKSFRIEGREYTPEDIHFLSMNDTIEDLIKLLEQGFEVVIR